MLSRVAFTFICLVAGTLGQVPRGLAQTPVPLSPPQSAAEEQPFTGSFGPGVIEEDVGYATRKDISCRNIATSPHDPNVAFASSWEGFIHKTEDGGKTWTESRLLVHRRPFYGDAGQMVYFGRNRTPTPALVDPSPMTVPPIGGDAGALVNQSLPGGGGGGGAGGQSGGAALANVNFGIGLPGSAPRLQNIVRKFGKPTSGLNIKQTLLLRGVIPKEIRRVVVHPDDPNVVFACSFFGVFKSYDSGYNWIRVFAGANPKENACLYIAIDPMDPRRVFAGTQGGMFISENSGEDILQNGGPGSWGRRHCAHSFQSARSKLCLCGNTLRGIAIKGPRYYLGVYLLHDLHPGTPRSACRHRLPRQNTGLRGDVRRAFYHRKHSHSLP